jgi:hypothetical protein
MDRPWDFGESVTFTQRRLIVAKFTTRVELHDATDDDYTELHSAMESEGFSRLIADSKGIVYHLPWAEYNFEGNKSCNEILACAKRAAKTTGCEFEILVTESAGRTWYNLLPVR